MGKRLRKMLVNHPLRTRRILEMLPGTMSWVVILFPLWGALFIPKVVAYFTVTFLIYWFYRSFVGAYLGIKGYFRIKQSEKINWQKKYLQTNGSQANWQKIHHLIIVPNYNETVSKLANTLDCIVRQKDIDKKQLWIVLAMEERAEDAHRRAKQLLAKYRHHFGHMLATFHPSDIVGEVKGKASNETWGAKQAKKLFIDKLGHKIKNLTITTCDADACFHPKYFSALTYHFLTDKNRYLRFWQSPMFNHNNPWYLPAFVNIVSTLSSVLHLAFIQEPDNLFLNYSTYSASWQMIDEVGYWDTDIIPEDWHIFLQSFFAKQGKIEVEPIFLPTSLDAPESKTYLATLKNRYEQCKRHAWGASDIPYTIEQAIKHPEIPRWSRFLRIYKIIECHLLWPTNWFILTLGGWAPALVNPVFSQTNLGYNLPKIAQIILTVCLLSLIIIITLDLIMRPKKEPIAWWRYLKEYLQWILMPVATLLMAIIPALDSQTRLMFGKRLEYKVTEKV